MASSSERKRKFLASNPICCFCGGQSKSEEPDHMPPRGFFSNRHAPEGYEFPACIKCNRATNDDEQMLCVITRFNTHNRTEATDSEYLIQLEAVQKRNPWFWEAVSPSAIETRRFLRRFGIAREEGKFLHEYNYVKIDDYRIHEAIYNFNSKQFIALYYKTYNEILTDKCEIFIVITPNTRNFEDDSNMDFSNFFKHQPKMTRSSKNLEDQFWYRYGTATDSNATIFQTFYRNSFSVVGFVFPTGTLKEHKDRKFGILVHTN